MVTPARTILLLLGALSSVATGEDHPFCEVPAEIRNLTLAEVRARIDAGSTDFFLYKRLLDLTPDIPKPGTLEPLFAQRLKAHPDDPKFIYLFARSLIGKRTPDAIAALDRVAKADPEFPWTYLDFAKIYSSPNFRDRGKFAASIHTYRDLCPASLEGYNWARSESDTVEDMEWAKKFRSLLENSPGLNEQLYWTALWAAEFRLAPKSEYPKLRAQVSKDLARLEKTPEPWNRRALGDLTTGYNLTERPQDAERLEHRLNPDAEAFKADHEFSTRTPWGTNLKPEEREAAWQELVREATEWTQKWPDSRFAWEQLLMSLPHKPGVTKQELERAGEGVLRADAAMNMGWSYISEPLRVAQVWMRYGIRLPECLAIAETALSEISLGPEERSDLYATAQEKQRQAPELFGFNHALFDAMGAIADASIQLKDYEKGRGIIARMEGWLNENQALAEKPSNGFGRFRGVWLNSLGKLAEAEGRKLDAIAYYTKAIAGGAPDSEAAKHARTLWDEMGGSKEGWASATVATPAPAKPPATAKPAVSTALQLAPWQKDGSELKEMNLHDVKGRIWTLQDLRGKATLVAVWATWCDPCREEMSNLQRLHELMQNRSDVQLVTLNVDEDPGLVEPFLAAHHFTFPVLMSARDYAANQVKGELKIPQNWIVDQSTILGEGSIGYDPSVRDWPRAMLDRLLSSVR